MCVVEWKIDDDDIIVFSEMWLPEKDYEKGGNPLCKSLVSFIYLNAFIVTENFVVSNSKPANRTALLIAIFVSDIETQKTGC